MHQDYKAFHFEHLDLQCTRTGRAIRYHMFRFTTDWIMQAHAEFGAEIIAGAYFFVMRYPSPNSMPRIRLPRCASSLCFKGTVQYMPCL